MKKKTNKPIMKKIEKRNEKPVKIPKTSAYCNRKVEATKTTGKNPMLARSTQASV